MHTNKINGKCYIGITSTSIEQRAGSNGKNYKKNPLFARAITKYGWGNFSHEILYSNLSKEEAATLEVKLIKEKQSNNPTYGYNISSGGESGNAGCVASDELRKRISQRVSGSGNPMYGRKGELSPQFGKKLSKDTIEKLRQINIGKHVSEETREKISQARKNSKSWCGENNPMFGKTGDKAPQARRVICVETGEIFNCIKFASETKDVFSTSITACCKGRVKTAGGYHWQYADI